MKFGKIGYPDVVLIRTPRYTLTVFLAAVFGIAVAASLWIPRQRIARMLPVRGPCVLFDGDDGLKRLSLETGDVTNVMSDGRGPSTSLDGSKISLVFGSGRVPADMDFGRIAVVFDARSGRVLFEFEAGDEERIASARLTPDGTALLLTLGTNGLIQGIPSPWWRRVRISDRSTSNVVLGDIPTASCEVATIGDGTRVYVSHHDVLEIRSIDGRILESHVMDPPIHEALSPSPRGDRVAYASRFGDQLDVCVVDLVRGGSRRLANPSADDLPIGWSPDGTQIMVYEDSGHGAGRLVTLALAPSFFGREMARHRVGDRARNPCWIPR